MAIAGIWVARFPFAFTLWDEPMSQLKTEVVVIDPENESFGLNPLFLGIPKPVDIVINAWEAFRVWCDAMAVASGAPPPRGWARLDSLLDSHGKG